MISGSSSVTVPILPLKYIELPEVSLRVNMTCAPFFRRSSVSAGKALSG